MSSIMNIEQFKQRIRCCRELAILRPFFGYTHHVFIGEVDETGCYIYHYTASFKSDHSIGKVAKVRLDYENHQRVRRIFNFEKGHRAIIVDRSDYPTNEEGEKNCIKRAQSRLGEENYSFVCNNCESYVNWIFKNDNTSNQIKESLKKQIIGNVLDGIFSRGIQHPSQQSVHLVVHKKKLKKRGKSVKTKRLQHSIHSSGNDTEFQKCTNDEKSLEFQRNTEIEKVSNCSTDAALVKDNKFAEKTNHINPELAKCEESQECSALIGGIGFRKAKEKSKGIEQKNELEIKDSSKFSKTVKVTGSAEFAKGSKSQRRNKFPKQIKTPMGTVKTDFGIGSKLPCVSKVPEELEVPKGTKLQGGSRFQTDTSFSKGADSKTTRNANLNGLLKLTKLQTELEFRNNNYSPPVWNQKYQYNSRDRYIRNGPEYSYSLEGPTSLWSPVDFDLIRANMISKYTEFSKGLNYKDSRFNDNRYHSALPSEKLHHVEEKHQSRFQQIDHYKDWMQNSKDPTFIAKNRPVVDANAQQILSQSNRNDFKQTLNSKDMVSKSDTKENQYSKEKNVESVEQNQSSPDDNGEEEYKQEANSTFVADVCSITVLESIFLLRKISHIHNDKHMTKKQKKQSIGREVGSSILGVTCSIIGQSLVPFPELGGWVGGIIGNAVGGLLGGTLSS